MDPYDWHFDRDGDGELDFHENFERLDFDDFVSKRGIYEESDDDEDDDDDGFDDDDFGDGDDFGGDDF